MYGTVDRIPRQPRWGALYALATTMLALVGVVEIFVPQGAWRRALEIPLTILGFWAIHLWVRANSGALDRAGARDPGCRRAVEQPSTVPAIARVSRWQAKPPAPTPAALAGTVVTLPRRRSTGS